MGDGLDIDLRKPVADEPPPPAGPFWKGALAWLWEVVSSWGPAILIVLTIRSIVAEPFQIPSGSMVPTLAIGDFIVISKFSYGLRVPFTDIEVLPLGEPERGDIVVFIHPPTVNDDPWCPARRVRHFLTFGLMPQDACTTDYIKRVVALPGDTVEVRDDVVYINGVEQPRTFQSPYTYTDQTCRSDEMKLFEETLDGRKHPVLQSTSYAQRMADFGPKTVPEGEYFTMGDNRDNSADSRVWGFVPRAYVKGKAKFVWLSLDACGAGRSPFRVRTDRIGQGLD